MIFILMFSTILIWLHISSLRFIIRTNHGNTVIKEVEMLEQSTPDEKKDISLRSGPGILSLFIIILLYLYTNILISIYYWRCCDGS